MLESIRSLNDCTETSTTDKAEILSNQFESVFSLADGNEPIFENRTEHLCSEEGIISKFNL